MSGAADVADEFGLDYMMELYPHYNHGPGSGAAPPAVYAAPQAAAAPAVGSGGVVSSSAQASATSGNMEAQQARAPAQPAMLFAPPGPAGPRFFGGGDVPWYDVQQPGWAAAPAEATAGAAYPPPYGAAAGADSAWDAGSSLDALRLIAAPAALGAGGAGNSQWQVR
eukprot:GHVT01006377.1.p2 GENE.GHVT01006377.1~~GHVT01006377.1.p2  ORF type:complete len:175 (+),score=68.89 GHVT01006377.1:25-525(+)